jgi:hypothetical protein
MKQKALASFLAALLLMFFSTVIQAAGDDPNKDTDTRMVSAKVVEVAESHISVMAQTGVEHVVAVDNTKTKVTLDGKVVSLKDMREGDVVTVELDAKNPVMFAKNISMRSAEVARVRR